MSVSAGPTGGRVLVVGAINVDLVVSAPRLPAPGETVVGPGVTRHGGGKGANAAVAAARAGAEVAFVGAVGRDADGDRAEADLRQDGVDCSMMQRLSDHPTGVALIVVDPRGENQIAVGAGANHELAAEHVADCVRRLAAGVASCVLVSTEIPPDAVRAAVAGAAAQGIACVLNPAPPTQAVIDVLHLAPILTPNRGELQTLLGMLDGRAGTPPAPGGDPDPATGARALSALTGAAVCVTLGPDGSLLCDGERSRRVAASPVRVRDATGAGDTFNGVLAAGLAAGESLDDALVAATTAASLSVRAVGARAGMPTHSAIAAARR